MKKSSQNSGQDLTPNREPNPNPFDFGKTLGATVYLLRKAKEPLTPQKLMHLLYLADRRSLLTFGDTITGIRWKVTPSGPFSEELQALLDGSYGLEANLITK